MLLVFAVIKVLLVIASVVSFIWIMLGTIPGIIFVVMYFSKKDQKEKSKYAKWIKISFGGYMIMVVVFAVWALIALIATFAGIPFANTTPIGK